MTFHAIYQHGDFRPLGQIDLPDPRDVEGEIRPIQGESAMPSLDEVYAILSERFDSGQHDVAERHNEHQP
jgi:hypothetical protein